MGSLLDLVLFRALFCIFVNGQKDPFREVVSIRFGNGSHDIGSLSNPAADEEPSGGFRDKGKDEEEEKKGGKRCGDVELAP